MMRSGDLNPPPPPFSKTVYHIYQCLQMFMLHVLTTCNKHTNKEFVIYSALSVSIIKMYFDYAL